MRCVLLSYDIPTSLREADGRPVKNPSDRLRRFGFRHQYSSWIMPEDSVPLGLVAELLGKGVRVDIVKFDVSESERLVRMALAALNASIEEQRLRSQEVMQEGWDRHREREAGGGLENNVEAREAAVKKFATVERFAVKKLGDLLEDVQKAAGHFGIEIAKLSIDDARSLFAAAQAGIKAQVAAYQGMTQTLRRLGKENAEAAALADKAEKDELPHYVASDFLVEQAEEQNKPELAAVAAQINAAFDGQGADGDTFSLADYGDE